MKHKRNKQSKKEYVKENIREFMKTAQNEKVFKSALKEHGIEVYKRGKNWGVKYDKQSFRFTTLGLDKAYNSFTKEQSKTYTRSKSYTKSKTKEAEHTNEKDKEYSASHTSHKEASRDENTNSRSTGRTSRKSEPSRDDEFNFTR